MRVAIAGYGDMTRYICEEFPKAGHELIILTRSHKPQLDAQGIAQAITDYTLPSIRLALVDCDTLISTVSDISPLYTEIHVTLIQACQESVTCKRFIPAEFATNIESYPDQPGFFYPIHEPIREMLRNQTSLEWTLVCVGWLADYFVPSTNRYIRDIDDTHPVNWVEGKIVIPGTGNEPVDFTWARDVARGLASLLNAPKGSWEPYTFMSGERSCWNKAVEIVRKKYLPQVQVQHESLYQVVKLLKENKGDTSFLLVDYSLLSISGACANPAETVTSHREKYFSGVVFRSLLEGLDFCEDHPSIIVEQCGSLCVTKC